MSNIDYENKKLNTERLNIIAKAVVAIITVFVGTFMVNLINTSFQNRQLEQQKQFNQTQLDLQKEKAAAQIKLQEEKAKADRRQAEMKYLGQYINYAIEEDIAKRIRFAEYFKELTISEDLQKKWEKYHSNLITLKARENTLKEKISEAKKGQDEKKLETLNAELLTLQSQLKDFKDKIAPSLYPFYEVLKNFTELALGNVKSKSRKDASMYIKDRIDVFIGETKHGVISKNEFINTDKLKIIKVSLKNVNSSLYPGSKAYVFEFEDENEFLINYQGTTRSTKAIIVEDSTTGLFNDSNFIIPQIHLYE